MREPDRIAEGRARFGSVKVDLYDSAVPFHCASDGEWLTLRAAKVRADEANNLAAAIAWYEARKEEGK